MAQRSGRSLGPVLVCGLLTRVICVDGVREKNGYATENQERNYNRHDTNPYSLAGR
jgi:hypothetical protein